MAEDTPLSVRYLIEARQFEVRLSPLLYSPLALQATEYAIRAFMEANSGVVTHLEAEEGLTVRVQASRFALFMAALLTERQRAGMSLEEKRRVFGRGEYQ